jgi:hypothetical protein
MQEDHKKQVRSLLQPLVTCHYQTSQSSKDRMAKTVEIGGRRDCGKCQAGKHLVKYQPSRIQWCLPSLLPPRATLRLSVSHVTLECLLAGALWWLARMEPRLPRRRRSNRFDEAHMICIIHPPMAYFGFERPPPTITITITGMTIVCIPWILLTLLPQSSCAA